MSSRFTIPDLLALVLLLLLPLSALVVSRWHLPDSYNPYQAVSLGQYTDAVALLRESVEKGDSGSNIYLGNLYRLGLGVPVNYSEAVVMYWETAQTGNPSAMINLGLMYREGLGVRQDPEIAIGWLNLALQYHEPAGQFYMSEMLANHEISGNRLSAVKKQYSVLNNMPAVVATK